MAPEQLPSHSNSPKALVFDHINGVAEWRPYDQLWTEQQYEPGPLARAQGRLQNGRLWWLGNRISDVRYWLWRVVR